jgi:hypothetical protein
MKMSRLKELLEDYGTVAIYTYFAIFVVVLGAFVVAIKMGIRAESTAGELGILGSAWLATKVTQPLRIAASIALTPVVVRFLRLRKKPVASKQ